MLDISFAFRYRGHMSVRTSLVLLLCIGCGSPDNLMPISELAHADMSPWDVPVVSDADHGGADSPLSADSTTGVSHVQFVADQAALPHMLNILGRAQKEILMCYLEFIPGALPAEVADALAAAIKRGVEVRVLLERDVQKNKQTLETLLSEGVNAALDSSWRTLHAKLMVVDGRYAFLGTTNISQSSLKYNHEVDFLVEDEKIAGAFGKYCAALFDDADSLHEMGTDSQGLVLLGDAEYAALASKLIKAAHKRVLLVMYQADYNGSDQARELVQLMIDAKKRGADVRAVLENSDFSSSINSQNAATYAVLKNGGVGVKFDTPKTVTHAKLLVVDDWTVVYSGNWSHHGLRLNHEVGLAVKDQAIADQAGEYFEKLWASF